MGVRGLSTYIADHSALYLKPYELCDTYLVIDGNSIASQLYIWYSKSCSTFGGDYDEYYKIVKKFFLKLLKCNVTPFVLLDGGHEKKKLKTLYKRGEEKLLSLKLFNNGFCTKKFNPLFLNSTFVDVLNDLKLICVRCDFEADGEIATVARALNCPVLSFDSDFYIYDVIYIPFPTVSIDPVEKLSLENQKIKYYMQCSVFEVTNFLNAHDGLDKSLLPIFVTLLGNDYVDSSIFYKFFNHIFTLKNKNASFTQRKIQGVIHWLKTENFDTAKVGILKHLRKIDAPKVLRAISQSVNDYNSVFLSSSVYIQVAKILAIRKIDNSFLKEKKIIINLPIPLSNSYSEGRIPSFVMDLLTLGTYYAPFQIENIRSSSSHFVFLDLIKAINAILHKYSVKKSNNFKLYTFFKKKYCPILVENNFTDFLSNINLDEILILSKNNRAQFLYKIVDFDEDDILTIESFPSDWSIFLISYLYWIKSMDSSITQAHIYSLFFMAVANQVVQKKTGYYENSSKFMKSNREFLNKFKGTTIEVNNFKSFTEMVNNLKKYECLLLQKLLIPLRHASNNNYSKSFSLPTLHLFNCLQSCLYYITKINVLLNYPFDHFKISDFYSGTLLYNTYLLLKSKSNVEYFSKNIFKDAPNIRNIYFYLCENFIKYSSCEIELNRKIRKRKKKKVKNKDIDDFIILEESIDSNDELFEDEENPYSMLQKSNS